MSIGLIGQKCGMTRLFTEDGIAVPVTVIYVEPHRVSQVKTLETDGYNAVQVTKGECSPSKLNKPEAGHFSKAKIEPGKGLWEFRVTDVDGLHVGMEFKVDLFSEGQFVDVVGISKGKGFAGTVKRWNFSCQDATHGNSLSHRAPGSIGQNQTPGRVYKGKKMAGHLGNTRCTAQNLQVIRVDLDRSLLLVRGPVPGAKTSNVIVKPAVKKTSDTQEDKR